MGMSRSDRGEELRLCPGKKQLVDVVGLPHFTTTSLPTSTRLLGFLFICVFVCLFVFGFFHVCPFRCTHSGVEVVRAHDMESCRIARDVAWSIETHRRNGRK